jgi:UDP-2-acetamido-3-amino-2,3-dideoxy-glucuronate N-acetyltransferase
VTKDVPDHAIVFGNPAQQHGWACECGLKLPLTGRQAACTGCDRRYEVLPSGELTPLLRVTT